MMTLPDSTAPRTLVANPVNIQGINLPGEETTKLLYGVPWADVKASVCETLRSRR